MHLKSTCRFNLPASQIPPSFLFGSRLFALSWWQNIAQPRNFYHFSCFPWFYERQKHRYIPFCSCSLNLRTKPSFVIIALPVPVVVVLFFFIINLHNWKVLFTVTSVWFFICSCWWLLLNKLFETKKKKNRLLASICNVARRTIWSPPSRV